MNYSRAAFQEWLMTLPQDEPFCAECDVPLPGSDCGTYRKPLCPIASFWVSTNNRFPHFNLLHEAKEADFTLTEKIDRAFVGWDEFTPREVLDIIDDIPELLREQ